MGLDWWCDRFQFCSCDGGDSMPRLFVALDLAEEAILAISRLFMDSAGGSWVSLGQLHLTLRFIGAVDEITCSRITQELAHVVQLPFELILRGVGRFPARGEAKILWVGVEENQGLLSLRRHIDKSLAASGIAPEERPFSPHITIARLRSVSGAWVKEFLEVNCRFTTVPCTVNQFHLYSSVLTPKGAVHHREQTYLLHRRTKQTE
jgi:RNA 2',3'-cyclic 3'-phosphodiesterase